MIPETKTTKHDQTKQENPKTNRRLASFMDTHLAKLFYILQINTHTVQDTLGLQHNLDNIQSSTNLVTHIDSWKGQVRMLFNE